MSVVLKTYTVQVFNIIPFIDNHDIGLNQILWQNKILFKLKYRRKVIFSLLDGSFQNKSSRGNQRIVN